MLGQKDIKWADIKLGFSDTTISLFGCVVTSIAEIIGTTPVIVNDRLKTVKGFLGNLVIWAKIEEAFPGIKVKRVWNYNNEDVKKNIPNVLVEVPAYPIGGTGKHWVVYKGNQLCGDPWLSILRPTADFPNPSGYCVLTGKWNQGIPLPPSTGDGNAQPMRQIIIDVYRALCGVEPTEDEIQFRLSQGINTYALIQDICRGDARFKALWVTPNIPPIPPTTPVLEALLEVLKNIIYSKWTWIGKNSWKNRLNQLKKFLPQ